MLNCLCCFFLYVTQFGSRSGSKLFAKVLSADDTWRQRVKEKEMHRKLCIIYANEYVNSQGPEHSVQ